MGTHRSRSLPRRIRRATYLTVAVTMVIALGAAPALACGGLVGENGTIQLVRTTTLAAYSDGIERYLTAFEFTGRARRWARSFRLPDVPDQS